jgi:hypothetical protein
MKHSVRMILFIAILALAICGQSVGYSAPPAAVPQTAGLDSGKPGDQARKVGSSDAAVAALAKLDVPLGLDPSGKVRWIEAANGELGDEAMQYLASLPYLEWLEVGGGKVTGAGMGRLKGCVALRRLYIHDVDLSKDALTWIAELRLEALSLQRTAVDAMALKQLKAAAALTVLNLSENGITDVDLSAVARFTNLEVLALQNTKVTGAGLAQLKEMKRLNVLNLMNCRIADADVSYFISLPNLRIVHAAGCNISDQAVKDITATLPMLAIFR